MGGGVSNIKKMIGRDKPPSLINPNALDAKETGPTAIQIVPVKEKSFQTQILSMNLNLVISPRRESALRSSVPFTPCGKEANIYCYYCPLCMEFFESILKTKCCQNYVCLKCTVEYLNAKGFTAESVKEVVGNSLLKSVYCPHCFTLGFEPQLVERDDSIRDYSLAKEQLNGGDSPNSLMTPLKIGDTFEELKRKMIPYAITKASSLNNGGIASISKNLSLPDLNKEKNYSLNSIFDAVAESDLGPLTSNNTQNNSQNNSNNTSNNTSNNNSHNNMERYIIRENKDAIVRNNAIACLSHDVPEFPSTFETDVILGSPNQNTHDVQNQIIQNIDRVENIANTIVNTTVSTTVNACDDVYGSINTNIDGNITEITEKIIEKNVQITVFIHASEEDVEKEVLILDNSNTESPSLKLHCRFVASEMMNKIIDKFILESDQ